MVVRRKSRTNYDDFEYVVEKKEQNILCFGSRQKRDTSLLKGFYMSKLSPLSYNLDNTSNLYRLLNKVGGNKGAGSLASNNPRFKNVIKDQVPGPNRYGLFYKWGGGKKSFAPFSTNTFRTCMILNSNPGIGTYNIAEKHCRRTKFSYNFGYPKMIPAVQYICVTCPTDKCDRCYKIIEGDYWHRNGINYLCQPCMFDEKIVHEMYSQLQLKEFKKIRNCSFMHRHENTTAAIRLLQQNEIKQKYRLENYLSLFMKSGN